MWQPMKSIQDHRHIYSYGNTYRPPKLRPGRGAVRERVHRGTHIVPLCVAEKGCSYNENPCRSTAIACANGGIFGSEALQNERSDFRDKARQSVPEPESRPFLDMAAESADLAPLGGSQLIAAAVGDP